MKSAPRTPVTSMRRPEAVAVLLGGPQLEDLLVGPLGDGDACWSTSTSRHGRQATDVAVSFRRLTDDDLPLLHRG